MSKRYIFEEVSYWLKWLLPIGLIVFSALFLFWSSKARAAKKASMRAT
jgi:cytochrome c-type biogenesis protein CcmH/NrfF